MWTLDPGLGPMFGRRVRLFAGLDARCPGAQVPGDDGQRVLLALAWLPSLGHAGCHRWFSWQQGTCLFSLHKDFQLRPPWWQCSCMSSPSVTLPLQEDSLPYTWLHALWASLEPASGHREVLDFPGAVERKPSFLSFLSSRLFADCWTRWTVPASPVSDGRNKQSIFCLPAPERDTALRVWDDFNWNIKIS